MTDDYSFFDVGDSFENQSFNVTDSIAANLFHFLI